jgi:hypothetical protein
LIYEKVLVGPVVPDFHGDVARLVELPTGGLRVDRWVKGSGWIEAPKGAFTLADFMPGYTRPASAKDAALLGIPASELDNVTAGEIAIAKHEMSRPRKLYGLLYGRKLPTPHDRHRAKLVGLIKERAWAMAAARVPPGHA